ncbi:hypothetical protein FDK21_13635 [Cohaesibacter sp. CAU 1516]|uniref:hypothetical protein n=1 Tax=Cohaesibacter sp. CAU 1516 TaxID=2576038 RepID=UPI0010FD6AC1|nr:hypothetical protein [Cohaesibacter sp. CAU 1516]TLP44809.1 hypothetical protein FDK21_13635 [Cohaesibacter sp. CAU 1516]
MPDNEKMKEKLGRYLSTLSESAQLLLLKSLERDIDAIKEDRATQLILEALLNIRREIKPAVPVSEFVRKEIFKPCEPFLSEIDHINKIQARISPASIEAIWLWIARDIASPEQKARLEEDTNDQDGKLLSGKVRTLCEELTASAQTYVNKMKRDPDIARKLGNQLGGAIIYEDLLEVLLCQERLENLKPVISRLPAEISSWNGPEGTEACNLLCKRVQQDPMKASWVFSAITRHLTQPRLKLQLATKLAGSDDAIQVAATVYAPAVKQVMADLEASLSLFQASLKDGGDKSNTIKYLSMWRKLTKALETELELPVQSPWGKSVAAMKTKLSELLKQEIVPAPGLVRKVLRAPKNGAKEHVDESLLNDAMKAIEIFHHVERMKDILALNAEISRIRKELDQSFEILSTSIVDRTKLATGEDVEVCKVLGDAAVTLAQHVFDENYANSLRRQLRAASMVPEVPATEQKAVGS